MKDSNALYTIIKSLTKSEKRIFKMQVSNGSKSNNNYTLLFDAIDAQNNYDESKLQRKLRKHTFSKQISRTKYLLYEQILKVLRQLYHNRSEHAKLGGLLGSVEVLFHKTLYQQAYEALKRAKKIAIANQLYGWQQKVLEWEKELLPYLENQKTIGLAIQQLLESYEQVAQHLDTENQYKALHTKVRLYYDTLLNTHETDHIDALFSQVMQHPLVKDGVHPSTFLSKVLFFEIHFLYAKVLSQSNQTSHWGKMMWNEWTTQPEMKSVFRTTYLRQLRDYTFWKITFEENQAEVSTLLEEWKTVPVFSAEEETKFKMEVDAIQFLLHLVSQNYLATETIYQRIQTEHLTHIEKFPLQQRFILFYHITVFHFLKKQYGEVWRWIEKVDDIAGKKLHPHLLKYIRLMELIVRYELEDKEVDDHDLLRIHRRLKSLGGVGKIEAMLLKSIKKLINLPVFDKTPMVLHELNFLLETEQNKESQFQTMSHQIFQPWVKEQLTKKRPYA